VYAAVSSKHNNYIIYKNFLSSVPIFLISVPPTNNIYSYNTLSPRVEKVFQSQIFFEIEVPFPPLLYLHPADGRVLGFLFLQLSVFTYLLGLPEMTPKGSLVYSRKRNLTSNDL